MNRILFWVLTTLTVVILLFGYRTSTTGPLRAGSSVVGKATTASNRAGGTTFDGPSVATEWGPVQVSITVSGGSITAVQVPVYPNHNHRDVEINNYALPILVEQTLDLQSADVDMVSGATVTSVGYRQSLQAALDQAGL